MRKFTSFQHEGNGVLDGFYVCTATQVPTQWKQAVLLFGDSYDTHANAAEPTCRQEPQLANYSAHGQAIIE